MKHPCQNLTPENPRNLSFFQLQVFLYSYGRENPWPLTVGWQAAPIFKMQSFLEVGALNTLIKTYQFKLYQNRKLKHLEACINLAAEIWNRCIAFLRRYYKATKKYPAANCVKILITKLKRMERFAHWNKLNSQAIQDIVERIDRSYQSFFLHL